MNNVKSYEFGGRVIETIVPTGATYSVTSTGNSIVNWMELR